MEEKTDFQTDSSCVKYKVACNWEICQLLVDLTKSYKNMPINKTTRKNKKTDSLCAKVIELIYKTSLSIIKLGKNCFLMIQSYRTKTMLFLG